MTELPGGAPRDTVIVGGGIAGLVVAWEVARAGRRVMVLEQSAAVGGAVARHRLAGLDLDAGAESFATATPVVPTLLADLGLADRVVSPDPAGAWVRHEAGTAPLPAGGLLGIPPSPWAADVRRVIGLRGTARACADLLLPRRVGAADLTLGRLVRRRMGTTVLRRLVEPVAGGVYSTDPDELELGTVSPHLVPTLLETGSLAAAVRRLRAGAARPGAAVAGLDGGMFTLVDALVAAITAAGGQLRTGVPAAALRRRAEGWRVVTTAGSVDAARVVLAVPAATAVALLAPVAAGTDWPAGPTTDVLLATLVLDQPALDAAPRGTGVLVSARASGVTAKALTHATAKWAWLARAAGPGRHVVRLSYGRGGAQDRGTVGGLPDPETLPELARRDAAELLGVPIEPDRVVAADVVRWSSAQPRPQVGHRDGTARMRAALPDGVSMVGAHLAGTGLGAVIADARATAGSLLR